MSHCPICQNPFQINLKKQIIYIILWNYSRENKMEMLFGAYEVRTTLLSVEADENVFPSMYLFSPLILCFILMSISSALSNIGESDACHFKNLLSGSFII